MKHFYFLIFGIFFFSWSNAQVINFPDANFKARLLEADSNNNISKNLLDNFFKIDSNNDGEIEVAEAQQVKYLQLENSNILSLSGIHFFSSITDLYCPGNLLTSLDVSSLSELQNLGCSSNQLNSLNINGLMNLEYLSCESNALSSLNITPSPSLKHINCNDNFLEGIPNIQNLPMLRRLECNNNQITSLNISGLANLQIFQCKNNLLTSLPLNGLSSIYSISCDNNNITSLNANSLSTLNLLTCRSNSISTLTVSGSTNLETFVCNDNLLQNLDLSGLSNLRQFDFSNNQLSNLDYSMLTGLFTLNCSGNMMQLLNVSFMENLIILFCDNNMLTSIDLAQTKVRTLHCNNNPLLTQIFLKNGEISNFSYYNIQINDVPNLMFICGDEEELDYIDYVLSISGNINCVANSYCTFIPGGTFYTINGSTNFDANNNGCDMADLTVPNFKLSIANGLTTGEIIPNDSGNYFIPVGSGAYTITPLLENAAFYNVSPSTFVVTFPATSSPVTQNFCITPNGIHNDLEITIIPVNNARPGFDATYKILYKNKGNQTQSGDINFTFDDAILDFVNANPTIASQVTNALTWSFINLAPFESREILVTLNVNSPMEVPPVNGGDVLNYNVAVNSSQTDETPADNAFSIVQTVVNSFDPNDKTCLEGTTITPEMIGKEVHYMIRFENTGTANAENIVLKDMIDTTKFDIASLIPIDGSHPFVTKISNTNKVEFIFENINLPFDDANNDGYVAFKIKTKPTLVLGDTFSNTASIYFDYNFPIITNNATTTVAVLANQDFAFENYINVYPNPAQAVLNIDLKKNIAVTSYTIYNTLGQLVLVIPNAQQVKTINVSSLKSGNYFLKVNSDKGSSNMKFIKQ